MATAQHPETVTPVEGAVVGSIHPSVPLYALAFELRRLLDVIAEQDGEVTPEQEAELAALGMATDDKIEAWGLVIQEKRATAKAVKAHPIVQEAERLAARARAMEAAADKLEARLLGYMAQSETTKVEGKLLTVATQLNPPSVKGELAPEALRKLWRSPFRSLMRLVPHRLELNKAEVVKAWKAKQPLPEGIAVEQARRIVLK